MTEQVFLEKLADTIDTEMPLTMATLLTDIEEWDSLAQVIVLSRIVEELGVNIPLDALMDINTMQDIIALVEG